MEKEIGYEKGQLCNRNNCSGIINENEKEGSCSCHIHPPCSHCEHDPSYCPKCDWSAEDEKNEIIESRPQPKPSIFKTKTIDDLDRNKIDWLSFSHTHFSMRKVGVFPIGTDMKDLLKEIRGTFGGRFKRLNQETGDFEYIAYTD